MAPGIGDIDIEAIIGSEVDRMLWHNKFLGKRVQRIYRPHSGPDLGYGAPRFNGARKHR